MSFMTPQQVLHFVADWAARALCQRRHRGAVTEDLEWVLLEACFDLLEFLVEEASAKEDWIRKRCQALSALIRLSSIPGCKKLLDIQEKVCQLGVISSPCDSNALYLLGNAQLAQYDEKPSSEEAQPSLHNAKLSFQASIHLENMPIKGSPPAELTSQNWWQKWKTSQDLKGQKRTPQVHTGKEVASAAISTKETSKGKEQVTSTSSRSRPTGRRGGGTTSGASSHTTVIPGASNTRAIISGGGNSKIVKPGATRTKAETTGVSHSKTLLPAGNNAKSRPTVAARGRPGAVLFTAAVTTSMEQAANHSGSVTPVEQSAPTDDSHDRPELPAGQASGHALVNSSSFRHRLGLARTLSRTKETLADAADLYREVIKMAPESLDAYTELAELLVKTDPLGAVDVYCQYPQKPSQEQSFDDAFIPGEIIHLLMRSEKYDDPRLPGHMISYGKVMGVGSLEKYITILEAKFKTNILKTVYAGIHNKSEDDEELRDFFRFKCWM
ncbi:hypothetical protein GDO78_010095 [Eleutherodactylus coqui]|nr:hypothetical protein GDO78_010095 [Eleutherodactylus coqui]